MRAGVCWKPDSSLFSVNNPSRSAEDPHAFYTTLSFCREPSTGHSVRQHQTVHHSLALLLHSGTHCPRPPSFFSQLLLSDQRSKLHLFPPNTAPTSARAHVWAAGYTCSTRRFCGTRFVSAVVDCFCMALFSALTALACGSTRVISFL